MALAAEGLIRKVWEALKLEGEALTPCSFAFSKTKPIPGDWRCFATDLAMPFWHVLAPDSRQGEIKKLVAGIAADNFTREELAVILESFSSFEEEAELEKMEEIKWGDALIRRFNGEVRRRVMGYFDAASSASEKEAV